MKKAASLFFVLALGFALPAHADRSTKIIRGGQGFLFPDHNSFENPGQFPLAYGMAFEAGYTKANGAATQSLTPSFVYGGGGFGIGAFYARSGNDIGSSAASSAGAGLGVSFLKDRLTVGASYNRSLESVRSSDGNLGVQINLNAPQRKGPSVGIGVESTLNATLGDTQSARGAVGYSFRTNDNIEAGIKFNNLRNTSDFSPYFAGTLGSQYVYAGAAYTYHKTLEDHEVEGRLGFILGRYIDLSALASYVLESGGATTYGATLRASF
jgi:hypothetical protein